MDWLLIENIKSIDKINVDLETKLKLRDHYRKILKEEKTMRE